MENKRAGKKYLRKADVLFGGNDNRFGKIEAVSLSSKCLRSCVLFTWP